MHHTKVKADIGLSKVISDLVVKGYVPNSINCPKSIRFDRTANNQARYVKWANNYLNIRQESSETIRRTPEKVKT